MVPGTFTMNAYPKFICRKVHIRVETTQSPFTSLYRKGEAIAIPIAHQEGRYVAPLADVQKLERDSRIAFRFCSPEGDVGQGWNPNGSLGSITGVLNEAGNVLAMMPHPERASEEILGSDQGKRIFMSMVRHVEAGA